MALRHSAKLTAFGDLPKVSINGESLRGTLEFFRYIRPYRRRFILGLCFLLAGGGMGSCFPLLLGGVIDAALKSSGAMLPGFGRLSLGEISVALAGITIMQAIAVFGSTSAFNRVGQMALADLRSEIYGRIICLPMTFFAQRRIGELASRISLDIAQIEVALAVALPQVCRLSIILFVSLALAAFTSVKLTLIMLCAIPLLIAPSVFFGRKIRRFSRETQDKLAETGTIVEETLQAIASVKAFANEAFELVRYRKANAWALTAACKTVSWRAASGGITTAALFGGSVILFLFGARLVQSGQITAGELTRFVLCTIFVIGSVSQASDLLGLVQRTIGATQRVSELLTEPVEVADGVFHPSTKQVPLTRLRGAVEFAAVSFRYPSRPETAVLTDVSLSARPGEVIALVGKSGAGKSTLTALLLRFYDPGHGRLLIDGFDARDYPLKWLRGQMALVPQDIVLFGGTIAENIAYGRPSASEAEIREAAKQANAEEFIRSFPEGYSTLVGDRGTKLSGGQRQRVAIARAILKNPAILILDEATSSLDSESERLVQEALQSLMRDRTTFVIAHRLATIRNADRIVVIDEGRVVESGTHEELAAIPDGFYNRLSALQFHDALRM